MSAKPIEGGLRSGLQTASGKPIPLRSVDVSGEVIGGTARVRVRQRYENVEKEKLEAIYVFPLPSEATLVGFVMECEGRRIEGVVREREEAFRAYDDATLEGHGAALLEQERANVFTATVGNLLPGESTLIEVEYVQRLHATEGALRVAIPTLVAPRYVPGAVTGDRTGHGGADPTDRVPDADRISPKIGRTDYAVGLDLTLHVGAHAEVSSPSHRIATRRDGDKVHVSFEAGRVPLDRDIVLLAEGTADLPLQTVVAHKQGLPGAVGTLALSRVVDLFDANKKPAPLDVVFVLDRSGSMGGSSIEEARKALRLCLRQLREGDRFAITAFDDRVEVFRPEPVPFTQKTLEEADRWIASIDARGGTELLEPLRRAVMQARSGVVVLLTDGQVGNEDEILAAVMNVRESTRVYTFGIGTNVSDMLLTQLARRTFGAVESIHPGERIDDKVVSTFSRAIAARVRDVRVKWTGVEVDEVAPTTLPDLIDGEPWTLFARYRAAGLGRCEIRGTFRGEPWLLEVPLDLPESADAKGVEKLWAAERIRDLESIEVEGRREKTMRDRIVAIATAHGIASRYTSFLAIETRTGDRRVPGTPDARPIPVSAPHGWAMLQPPPMMAQYAVAAGPPPGMMMPRAAPAPFGAAPVMAKGGSGGIFQRARRMMSSAFAPPAGPPQAAPPPPPPMVAAPMPMAPEMDELAEHEEQDPVFAILSTQLASGLFDEGAREKGSERDEELRLVASTSRALTALLRAGIDAAHPLHGELVRKAIAALLPLAIAVAPRDRALAERALSVCLVLATGKRTRSQVLAAASTAGLADLAARSADEDALRAAVLSPG